MAHFKNDFEDPGSDGDFDCNHDCENCGFDSCDDREKYEEEEYLIRKYEEKIQLMEENE